MEEREKTEEEIIRQEAKLKKRRETWKNKKEAAKKLVKW